MGETLSILACALLKEKCLNVDRLTIEMCESIHLHYRDIRLALNEKDFISFSETIAVSFSRFAQTNQHCNPGVFVELARSSLKPLMNRESLFTIEELPENVVHLHFRNLRIELTSECFESLAKSFWEAYSASAIRSTRSGSHSRNLNQYESIIVNLDKINPYDNSHRKCDSVPYGFECNHEHETQDHVDGINLCADLVTSGCRMLPIAITPIENRNLAYSCAIEDCHRFQRLDGFKRYMAHRKLGIENIECYIYHGTNAFPGNQRYIPWVIP